MHILLRITSIFLILIFLFTPLGLITPEQASASTNVSACGTLASSSEIYVLTQNIGSGGTCLTVAADNIVINGAGFTINGDINGNATTTGATGHTFTVKNVTVDNIYANGAAGQDGSMGSTGDTGGNDGLNGLDGGTGGDGGNGSVGGDGGDIYLADVTVTGTVNASGGAGGAAGAGGTGGQGGSAVDDGFGTAGNGGNGGAGGGAGIGGNGGNGGDIYYNATSSIAAFVYDAGIGGLNSSAGTGGAGGFGINGGNNGNAGQDSMNGGSGGSGGNSGSETENTVGPVRISAPSVVSSAITITYDETLDVSSIPSTSDFTLLVDSASATISSVSISGTVVTLYLQNAVSFGQTVTLSYTLGANKIQDAVGNPTTSFSATTVTNDNIIYQYITKWGSVGSGNGQFFGHEGVAVDSSGNVYVADTLNNRIQKFTSSGVYVTKWGSSGSGNGQFSNPRYASVDTDGNVYVSDSSNYRIQKFTSSGVYVTKWGSSGSGNGQFNTTLGGVAIDASGNVYVTDTRIQKFDSNGTYITSWAGIGGNGGKLAIDASGNMYVGSGFEVKKYDSNGNLLTTWGSSGEGSGQFKLTITGVAVDSSGYVFVADNGHRVQKFDSSGTYVTYFGSAQGSANGEFIGPRGVAVDSLGNVYAVDQSNYRIQKFAIPDSTGPVISSIASSTSVTTATITWTTNEAATSTLNYGTTASYGTASSSATATTSHSIALAGLATSTPYHFQISVWDSNGNLSTSSDAVFTTTAAPDTTAPIISEVTPVTTPTTDTTPDYTFTTNEAGTITYGGSCSSLTTSATVGSNTITLVALAVGTYSNCTITVTDSSSNISNTLTMTSFTVAAAADEDSGGGGGGSSGRSNSRNKTTEVTITPSNNIPTIPSITNTSPITFTRDLDLHDQGDDVKSLQDFLISKGLLGLGNNTGYFGQLTFKALVLFQQMMGIEPAVGRLGPITRALFNSTPVTNPASTSQIEETNSSRDLTVGDKGADVLRLQQYLKDKGFFTEEPTGYFGNITKQSLMEFQKANGISPATGYFGPVTRTFIELNQ